MNVGTYLLQESKIPCRTTSVMLEKDARMHTSALA